MSRSTAHIISGGTVSTVRPHLALAAPAYGATGRALTKLLEARDVEVSLHLTRMAGGPRDLESNEHVAGLVDRIVDDPGARILFMPVALCDFTGTIAGGSGDARLESREGPRTMSLVPADKVISRARRQRKDLFLVGFKASAGASEAEQFRAALRLVKTASCNLVLANDVRTGACQIVTPEESSYPCATRERALETLVEMALERSRCRFTRSTVLPGAAVPWSSPLIPDALRRVVDHCIRRGAYKPFLTGTVGHFAVSLGDGRFLTSRRKTDFNELASTGLVRVETRGDDHVLAVGGRPSVGGQSQRMVFAAHPDLDCIVHFHCPMRASSRVPVRTQRSYECGSHECGANTRDGLALQADGLMAVMLERHGPNLVFSRHCDPEQVIAFIEENFDLEGTTRPSATLNEEAQPWLASSALARAS